MTAHTPESGGTALKAGLKPRHLTMISIAGVIGAALFIGSGKVLASAGPLPCWPILRAASSWCW